MFGRSSKKQTQIVAGSTEDVEFNLLQNFTDICLKKCLKKTEIEEDLNMNEKACLGKCIDRAYDYLKVTEKVKL